MARMNFFAKETQIKSKTVVRYISRSPRVPCVARCIEGCERETLDKTTSHPTKLQTTAAKSLVITTNGLNLRFPNVLFAASCVVSTLAHAGSVPYADTEINDAIINKPAEIRLGFEQTTLPGNEAMGMVGASYLIQVATGFYFGPAAYGAITGHRGGFFTVGGEVEWHQHLVSKLVMEAGVYGGGGGGGSSPAGGGLMIRPHVDLLWDFGGYHAGISASNVRFPNGSINSNQVGLMFSADSDFSYSSPNHVGQQVDFQGPSGMGFDRVLITTGVYKPRSGTTSSNIGYVGARLEQFFYPSLYRGIEAVGAASGGVAGYAEFLGTLGAETPVWDDKLAIGARLGIGMGGGGAVSVGGGSLIKLGAYTTVSLSRNVHLALEGGYANAPGGKFSATYGSANFVWDLDHPYTSGRQATIVGNEWVVGSEHYFGAAHKGGSKRDLEAVTIKLNRYLTDSLYLTAQAHSAYSGNAGAYSVGLVGAGYHTPKFAYGLSAGAELLVGAAGGGSVDTSSGAVVQTMVYLGMDLTDAVGLRLSAGRAKSIKGALNSNIVDMSVSFAFGTASR